MRSRESKLIREHYNAFRADISSVLTEVQLEKLDRQLHPDSVRLHRRWERRDGN